MSIERTFTLPEFGYEVTFGKFAGQADGSAWLKQGGTVILSTIVSAPAKEFPGFFPLTVDYREQFAAAGKIPGGYLKREGKSSDREVLTGRLIDRAIRPLFPYSYFDQVQVLSTVYSVDQESMLQPLALLAASLALTSSRIPILSPVGACEIARVEGKWIFNPTYKQSLASDARVLVAGDDEGILMVESCVNEVEEKTLVDLFFTAHETIKKQVAWQKEIQKELAVEKSTISDPYKWDLWSSNAEEFLTKEAVDTLFTQDKLERSSAFAKLEADFFEKHNAQVEELKTPRSFLAFIFDVALKAKITDRVFERNQRLDLRDSEKVRTITSEVGLLPFNHGSSLFKRGRTQALTSVTLGSGQDEKRIENLRDEETESPFMLHYNFPAFSVGEVKPNRGPSRRDIGHGALAASAIIHMLPDRETSPYTIRIVTDILESDGSSSMATVCGSTLALMNAGIKIRSMVSGVAMGLLKSSEGKFLVVTDIAGAEDAFGLMDFKVAGTENGVTAIQMDIKNKGGLPRELFIQALEQARRGRLFILGEMRKTITEPAAELSPLVPRFVTFRVPTDKIGAIIGSGGKIIKEIIEKTGTSIDIEDDGLVKIFGQPGEKLNQAVKWVELLSGKIIVNEIYNGKIKRHADFGMFVELAPGFDGLVHISMFPREAQNRISEIYKIGEDVLVRVLEYDTMSGKVRLKIVDKK